MNSDGSGDGTVRQPRRLAAWIAGAGASVFVALAVLVPAGVLNGVDEGVLRVLRRLDDPQLPLGGSMIAAAARDITSLGGGVVLVLVVLSVALYFAMDRRTHDALAVLLASIGGTALDLLLKALFARERPEIVPHLVAVHSASFPSGHSMLTAIVYPTLGALVARFARRRGTRVLPIAVAVLVTFLVGISRIVLGVHYPTDVLAGWAAGAAWAASVWLVVDRLARRGAVEGRRTPPPAP